MKYTPAWENDVWSACTVCGRSIPDRSPVFETQAGDICPACVAKMSPEA